MNKTKPIKKPSSYELDNTENKTVSLGSLPKDLWEPITAFSNMDGGKINLGIDPNNKPVGVNPKFHDKIQTDLTSQCKSAYNYPIYPDILICDNNTISVYIPPAPAALRPVHSLKRGPKNGARVRIGSSNVQVDSEWIKRFAIAAKGGAELITFEHKHDQYFDKKQIDLYLKKIKQKRGNVYKGIPLNQILKKLRALDKEDNVTLFGLLAFSNEYGLQELTSPTVNIAVTQYAGTTKVNPSDINQVSLDDREFNGNTVSQYKNAFDFIKSKLPIRGQVRTGGKRFDYLAIPEIAIRETLANAIVHKEYTTYGSRIQIDIYTDRIEFTNPGRSLIPIEQLETAHSQTRNPLLMNYLRDLKVTEHRGRGITTIKRSLNQAGLAEPIFTHQHNWFIATLFSSAFINDENQIWLQQFHTLNLKEQQLRALVHVKHNQTGINNSEYRKINNMTSVGDDIRAKKDLAKLVKHELLKKVGVKRHTRYILNVEQ